MGYTYTKNLFIVYLKFEFNQATLYSYLPPLSPQESGSEMTVCMSPGGDPQGLENRQADLGALATDRLWGRVLTGQRREPVSGWAPGGCLVRARPISMARNPPLPPP